MSLEKVALEEIARFMKECLIEAGTPDSHAVAMADVLLAADKRGHYSHGLNRLEMYVREIRTRLCDPCAEPQVIKDGPSTAWVEGNNGLGPVVGNFCMKLAIEKARTTGVGWVVAKGSNHFGMAGWYSMMALRHNMMGMAFSNSSPLMGPTRSKQPALGTNPMTVAAPGEGGESFVLDMATSAVALGKIEVQKRKQEAIPQGWALDPEGRETTDPWIAYDTGCLMPLGGAERNSGYKGYGLALMVEVLAGISAGSEYGPNIRKWGSGERVANLGHCFVAVDVHNCFAPGFESRMTDMNKTLRDLPRADPDKPVLVAGDPEKANESNAEKNGGVYYHKNLLASCENLAKELNVRPMTVSK